jgi:outer membrane lipoprotein-sorting protein
MRYALTVVLVGLWHITISQRLAAQYPNTADYPPEFSAEVITSFSNGNPTSITKVYKKGDNIRVETISGPNPHIFIASKEANKTWTIFPNEKMYNEIQWRPDTIEASLDPSLTSTHNLAYVKVGPEILAGHLCDKYEMTYILSNQPRTYGMSWIDQKTSLPVKIVTTDDTTEVTTEMKNVIIGLQDSKLFILPSGLHKIWAGP